MRKEPFMKLELIALVDYINMLLAYHEIKRLKEEPIETIYINHMDWEIIGQVDRCLQSASFRNAADLLSEYKCRHKEISRIYEVISQDYCSSKEYISDEDMVEKIRIDFGVKNPEELVTIMKMRELFLVEQ